MKYDVIAIGGGIGGSTLAGALAEAGLHVLVLEREVNFKDRVRGEQMHPWGVAEARTLGIYNLLKESCAHEVQFMHSRMAGVPNAPPRDLVETSPHHAGSLHFYHPEMQSVLLERAEERGAEVHRGAAVLEVVPGHPASVRVDEDGEDRTYTARLVVGADGRTSSCRAWGGFPVRRDPERMVIAGLLLDQVDAPDDTLHLFTNPKLGWVSLVAPLGGGRARCYACSHKNGEWRHLSGRRAVGDFIATSTGAGAPAEWFEGAEPAGPLASFEGADTWVDHPYKDGVALVGDAAASSDPSFGCGLSLTLRDVRMLRDRLVADDEWDRACHAYAEDHDRCYGAIHRLTGWMRTMVFDPSPEAWAIRARAMPHFAEDPSRVPDIVGTGPEFPSDEAARRRFFGEV